MDDSKKEKETKKAEIKKQNQDFPNIPASSEKHTEEIAKKEIRESSKMHKTGKTENEKS